jgi:hypothetical protein
MNFRELSRPVAAIVLTIFMLGCSAPPLVDPAYKEIPAQQSDAGYASASIVSMIPLSVAESVLNASSTLTYADAYKLVQSYSRFQHNQAINSLQVGINVGLSGRTVSSTGQDTTNRTTTTNQTSTVAELEPAASTLNNGTKTTSTTTTVIDSTGKTSSKTSIQTVVQGTASTPELGITPTFPIGTGTFGTVTFNPTIAAQAADQLLKLHNMVSAQFKGIPYAKNSQRVFIVQIKSTLQPHKPALPLDAFVTLTVVPDFSTSPATTASISLVPLAFGTEEYEFGQLQSADTYMRGLALGLTAVSPGGAFSGSARSLVGRVLEASAVNVNGLISATPLSPSTVQVRLGAMWQGANDRVMIPRSFNGFFALVVPRSYEGQIELIAKPLFRDPKTGAFISGTPPSEIIRDVKREFCTFGLVLERGCSYSGGRGLSADIAPDDDWFAFLRRIRRNDYSVLSCLGVRLPAKVAVAGDVESGTTCRTHAGGPLQVAMVESGTAQSRAPGFMLGSFISEINRVGLNVRSSSSFVTIPPETEAPVVKR